MPSNDVLDPGLPCPSPTNAYWQCPPHALATRQSPDLLTDAAVVVIGSGITGTSVAYNLLDASPHLKVVMLEARTTTSGATGRNGGHCKDVPYKHYKEWKSTLGIETAQKLVKFRGSHIDITRRLAQKLSDAGLADAQFRDVETLTAVFDPSAFEMLEDNMQDWLQDFPEEKIHCETVTGADAEKRFGIVGSAGVLISRAAALWPYRLVTGLLTQMLRDFPAFSLEALTPVVGISGTDNAMKPYLVHTSRGTIRAQHVVHCTNGYVSHLVPALRRSIVPVRGQMTALEPPDTFPRLGHMRSWSLYYSNGGFDYMTQAAGESGEIFLGGGVEQAAAKGIVDLNSSNDANLNAPALDHLCRVLPDHFVQGSGTILKQAWTGIMGFTPDGFPIVGCLPTELDRAQTLEEKSGSEWIAAGFNGYGMVQSWLSGKAIADMIMNVPGEIIDAYFPSQQFACSVERLTRMDYDDLYDAFHKNASLHVRSHI